VPTLKGGSGLGIPSPPAIWMPDGHFVLPDIRDAERLQGFPAGWTEAALTGHSKEGARWKLVGNAVSVPVSRWLGDMPSNNRRGRPQRPLRVLYSLG
jgi:DNA (cytosine-5)-methyltransferase 1